MTICVVSNTSKYMYHKSQRKRNRTKENHIIIIIYANHDTAAHTATTMKTIITRTLFTLGLGSYLFFLGGFYSIEERNRRRLLADRREAVEIFIEKKEFVEETENIADNDNNDNNDGKISHDVCDNSDVDGNDERLSMDGYNVDELGVEEKVPVGMMVGPFLETDFEITERKRKDLISGTNVINSNGEPYVGMMLSVRTRPRLMKREGYTMYELTERVHDELGLKSQFKHDWAYAPVTSNFLEQDKTYEWKQDISQTSTLYTSTPTLSARKSGTINGDSYFSWLYSHTFGYVSESYEHEKLYERLGNSFAGGSHGEVWRARRRGCRSSPLSMFEQESCNDNTDLVMKRLNVGQNRQLLEAGLREVYFGEKLSNETLFTKYVDHFYRNSTGCLELWIVFEDGGPSLRSIIYTPIASDGFVIFQHSEFWRNLRFGVRNNKTYKSGIVPYSANHLLIGSQDSIRERGGRHFLRDFLRQLLTSVAVLHEKKIIHRDIKPSNILCKLNLDESRKDFSEESTLNCILADFSSAFDKFTAASLYKDGLTPGEITEEYAPPEVLFSSGWVPFDFNKPQSFDMWSVGVVVLELLLGSPNVFSVDQRTRSLITNKLKKEGASDHDINRALYLAALSQFCIYIPTSRESSAWMIRNGNLNMGKSQRMKKSCTIDDFHMALRARDPLGIGFGSSSDDLLRLIWKLLTLDPRERISAREALNHEYFVSVDRSDSKTYNGALVTQMKEPVVGSIEEFQFTCPKCGKKYNDLNSCLRHSRARRHAKFCHYDRSSLPSCISSHAMLPVHATSGYCDIQGRRPTIEDFHTVVLQNDHQFYGVFDGHNGNLASKYAASSLYGLVSERLSPLLLETSAILKIRLIEAIDDAFEELHSNFLRVAAKSPGGVMSKSGTTVTIFYVSNDYVIIANLGDSRAILSKGANYKSDALNASAIQLTVDHTASDDNEKKRVKDLGGTIKERGGIERLDGLLAITRSIGDAHLQQFTSRKPHVLAMTKDEIKKMCMPDELHNERVSDETTQNIPCFLVLASDGLWDVVPNEEVINIVVDVLQQESEQNMTWNHEDAFQEAAQRLTHEAYVRGSTDNIGVCVIAII